MRKSLFFITALAFVMSGCKKDDLGKQTSEFDEVTLSGKLGVAVETKTTLGDTELDLIPVLWSANDAIGIFTYTPGATAVNAKGSLMEGVGTRNGKFTSLNVKMAPTANVFYLYYPYDKEVNTATQGAGIDPLKYDYNGGTPFVAGVLSATQDQKEPNDLSHFANYGCSVAISEPADKGEEIQFEMQHILTYLRLSIYGAGDLAGYSVEEITVKAPSDVNLSGPYKGFFDGNYQAVTSSDPTVFSNSISLNITNPAPITSTKDPAQKFLVSMLPADLSGKDLKIMIKVSKGVGEDKQSRFYSANIEGTAFNQDCLTRIDVNLGSWLRIYPLRATYLWAEDVVTNVSDVKLITGTEGTDLSAKLANSYIVRTPGTYTIPAKRADGMWIDGIDHNEFNNISFTIPAGVTKGNVTVALYRWDPDDDSNSSNTILYTWHIWVTDVDEAGVNVNGTTFLDRDLGATSVDKISIDALPLYYQWGRKDAFPRANTRAQYTDTEAKLNSFITHTRPVVMNTAIFGNLTWTLVRSRQDYNDSYSKPTYFIDGTILGYDAVYGTYLSEGHVNMPSYNPLSITTWPSHADPCPYGYRVPTVAELQKLTAANTVLDGANFGRTISGMWFADAGYRNNEYGNFRGFGSQLLLWSNVTNTATGATGKYATSLYADAGSTTLTYNANGRISGARPVRCVKK